VKVRRHPEFKADERLRSIGHPIADLLATQIVSRVCETFDVDLPLRRFFDEPNIARLTEIILRDNGERARIERIAEWIMSLAQLSEGQAPILLARRAFLAGEGGATN
jgi:hypothetical protein